MSSTNWARAQVWSKADYVRRGLGLQAISGGAASAAKNTELGFLAALLCSVGFPLNTFLMYLSSLIMFKIVYLNSVP